MVGKFDSEINSYIRNIHLAGGIVIASIVIAGVMGIIAHSKPSLLCEQGRSLDLGKGRAQSFLCQHVSKNVKLLKLLESCLLTTLI